MEKIATNEWTGRKIVPCLWMDSQAEEAARFYARTFPQGRILESSHYPQEGENPSGKPAGSVLTVEFEIAGQRFTALNGGTHFKMNPSISFFVHLDTAAEVDRLYAALVDGGQALMPVDTYPWSDRYAWVQDRFGTSWQVMAGRRTSDGPVIAPCLMFTGPQKGRAFEAMEFYTRTFPGGRIGAVDRYAEGAGPKSFVSHGRFVIDGQELVAMDSHIDHAFSFDEAISLQVMCEDQAEVDRYWVALSEGGSTGPCGWLKDRFGVSWQVVPAAIADWLASEDIAARDRAFQAVMGMTKLDIARIEAAFRGA